MPLLPWSLILAVDPASSFGWALFRRQPRGGLTKLASGALQTKGPWGGRFLAAQRRLSILLGGHMRPDDQVWVAYEDVGVRALKSWDNLRVVTGLTSAIYAAAHEAGVPDANIAPIPISTNKLHATGDGRADKAQMVEAFTRRWGEEPTTNDEADAAHVGALLAAMLDGEVPPPNAVAWRRLLTAHGLTPAPKPTKGKRTPKAKPSPKAKTKAPAKPRRAKKRAKAAPKSKA